MTSKQFLESSSGMKFVYLSVRLANQKPRLYPFDTPIKSLYFRSFIVSVLFVRFHFKVIRKSLYYTASHPGIPEFLPDEESLFEGSPLRQKSRPETLMEPK